MQAGYVYDNLEFRRTTAFTQNQPVYDPPLGTPALRLQLEDLPAGAPRKLLLLTPAGEVPVVNNVVDLQCVLNGRVLTVTVTVDGGKDADRALEQNFVIRSP